MTLKSCSSFLPNSNKKCFNAAAANEISAVSAEQYEAFNRAEGFLADLVVFILLLFVFFFFTFKQCGWNRPQLWICGLWLRAADLQISALQTLDSLLIGVTRLKNFLNLNKIRARSLWHHRCSLCVFWPGELPCQALENVGWKKYQQWNPLIAALCAVADTCGGNIILEASASSLMITFSRMSPLFALEQSRPIICMPHNSVTLFYPSEKCIIYYTFGSTKAFKVIVFPLFFKFTCGSNFSKICIAAMPSCQI